MRDLLVPVPKTEQLEARLLDKIGKVSKELASLKAQHESLLKAVAPILPMCVLVKTKELVADDSGDWLVLDGALYCNGEQLRRMARRAYRKIRYMDKMEQLHRSMFFSDHDRHMLYELERIEEELAVKEAPTMVLSLALAFGFLYRFEYLEFYEHKYGEDWNLTACIANKQRYDSAKKVIE